MTTRLAGLASTVIHASWNDTGRLQAFAGGPRNNRLICRELSRARSEGVRLASQAAPAGLRARPVGPADR